MIEIRRDGKLLATVEDQNAALRWFHQNTSHSFAAASEQGYELAEIVAAWRSVSGKHFVTIERDTLPDGRVCYSYRALDAGGVLGVISEADAVAEIERRLDTFQPDANKTPLRRVES